MPQQFHVLKCFKCGTFQVHIVKKINKWECKMCGSNQSVIQVYGNGSSKDCRIHVQKLNELRFNNENALQNNDSTSCNTNEDCFKDKFVIDSESHCSLSGDNDFVVGKRNKWNKYIENTREIENSLNISSDKRKIQSEESPNKKICTNTDKNDFSMNLTVQNNSLISIPFMNLNKVSFAEYEDETDKIVFKNFKNSYQRNIKCSNFDNSSQEACYKTKNIPKMKVDFPTDKNIFNMDIDDDTDLDEILNL